MSNFSIANKYFLNPEPLHKKILTGHINTIEYMFKQDDA